MRFHAVHEAVYREHGFEFVNVPPAPVTERVALVDTHMASLARAQR